MQVKKDPVSAAVLLNSPDKKQAMISKETEFQIVSKKSGIKQIKLHV